MNDFKQSNGKIIEKEEEFKVSNGRRLDPKDCPHKRTFSYNHGYHTICEDCGEEL